MGLIKESYPIVFGNNGVNKPHSSEYTEFTQKWGFIGTIYSLADEKIEKVKEINQEYLTDVLQFLTYMIEKGKVDEREDAFQEALRKAKRGR